MAGKFPGLQFSGICLENFILHQNQYVRGEHYNRDVQVLNLKPGKLLFKEKFANLQKFQPSKFFDYIG